MDVVHQLGLRLIAAIQSIGPAFELPMRCFSLLGQEDFFRLLLSALYWCVDSSLGMRLTLLLLFSHPVNAWAKWALHAPRPYWLVPSLGRAVETSYGVPSGHAQNAVVIWLFLAAGIRRRAAWVVAVGLILLVSLSRLYLGVHFPHDVLVGWLLGGGCLWLFLRGAPSVEQRLGKCSSRGLAGAALGIAGVVALVSVGILSALSGVADPAGWAAFAKDARSSKEIASGAGMIAGAVLGFGLQYRRVQFDAGGAVRERVLRFLLGTAGMVLILSGLGSVLPGGHTLPGYLGRFARYFLAIFWAAFLAPWVFVRLGTARTVRTRLEIA
ncbi:MAG: phosphatase PAP2 family protein [Armatimonadetes bacterium]|nr:phosphatase PAP2 family protein [Armatimonadota bacterium]